MDPIPLKEQVKLTSQENRRVIHIDVNAKENNILEAPDW